MDRWGELNELSALVKRKPALGDYVVDHIGEILDVKDVEIVRIIQHLIATLIVKIYVRSCTMQLFIFYRTCLLSINILIIDAYLAIIS